MTVPTPLLLYLHGLNSSPASQKAQQTIHYIQQQALDIEVLAPQLSTEPTEVARYLKEVTETEAAIRPIYIIGSSLGGYLGTWLHQYLLSLNYTHPVRLAVVNPAVRPYELFGQFLGSQENLYTGEKWVLTEQYAEQLKQLEVSELRQTDSILLLAQTGDEVLDYRLAEETYNQCHMVIQKNGSHAFERYGSTLPVILNFFQHLK